jgi:hypothetical protein
MRSEYVFAASRKIGCRFLLCRVASVSARRLQVGSNHASASINESLRLISVAALAEEKGVISGELRGNGDNRLGVPRASTTAGQQLTVERQLETLPAG